MSLKLYKEQYEMLEKIAAEMHNANVKMADESHPRGSYSMDATGPLDTNSVVREQNIPRGSYSMDATGPLDPYSGASANPLTRPPSPVADRAWHQAITDPIRRAAGWVDDKAMALGGLTGAERPWLQRTLGYGAPALAAAGLGAGAYALANRGGGEDPQQQESLASADLYNTIRQLQAENAEFRAYFQKQASASPSRTVDDLSLEEKREFFQKHASPDQQNQMFVDEVVKTAAAMLTVNGLENGSNPFDPIAVREAAVDLLRSKGYKV